MNSRCRSKPLSSLFAVALIAAVCWAYVPDAHAHAAMVKSDPARRAVLTRSPTHVRLWFNERLEPAYSSLSVLDAVGRAVTPEPATLSEEDPKLLILALPELPPGTYKVRYRVLSVDSHIVNSSYSFTIKAASQPE